MGYKREKIFKSFHNLLLRGQATLRNENTLNKGSLYKEIER